MSQQTVEQEISDRLEEQVGVAPADVECPDGLAAEEGTTMRCVLTADDGSQVGVTVTVTQVDDGDVAFDIEADDEVMP